jgi:hypothetical protein
MVMKRLPVVIAMSLLVTTLIPSLGEAGHHLGQRLRGIKIGHSAPVGCKGVVTRIHAFTVSAEWNKRVYSNTEKALVIVTVTRPAPEDPLGLGIPTDSPITYPVEGATVTTSVDTDRYPFPYGYGHTNADGQVGLKVPLQLLEKPGPYDVDHLAELWTNQGGCPDIQEWGYLRESPGFTIRP